MAMNKWLGVGRLTRDPEKKPTASGLSLCTFTMAVNRKYKRDGEPDADFINVVAWRQTADFVCNYFAKGDPIQVEGRLQIRKYEQDGVTKYAAEIIADDVSFVEGVRKKETDMSGFDPAIHGDEPYGEDDLPF